MMNLKKKRNFIKRHKQLIPKEIFIGLNEGKGSNSGDKNPHKEGTKSYVSWKYGYDSAREQEKIDRVFDKLPLYRQLLCKHTPFHKYEYYMNIPGRPKIGRNGNIIDRDPAFKQYRCKYCSDRINYPIN